MARQGLARPDVQQRGQRGGGKSDARVRAAQRLRGYSESHRAIGLTVLLSVPVAEACASGLANSGIWGAVLADWWRRFGPPPNLLLGSCGRQAASVDEMHSE